MQILCRGHQRVSETGLQTGTAIGHQRSKNRALWAQQVPGSGVGCLINIHTYLGVSSVGPLSLYSFTLALNPIPLILRDHHYDYDPALGKWR